ncbi:hypothetical protein Tco_0462269 [Tanacetum coccineum]
MFGLLFEIAINTTPYEAVYYQTPPIHVPYIPGDSMVENVDGTLQSREEIVKMLKFHMKRAQDRMESQANKHRTDREFEVVPWEGSTDGKSTPSKGGWTFGLQAYGNFRKKIRKS